MVQLSQITCTRQDNPFLLTGTVVFATCMWSVHNDVSLNFMEISYLRSSLSLLSLTQTARRGIFLIMSIESPSLNDTFQHMIKMFQECCFVKKMCRFF